VKYCSLDGFQGTGFGCGHGEAADLTQSVIMFR
jgi:hypothetical protein